MNRKSLINPTGIYRDLHLPLNAYKEPFLSCMKESKGLPLQTSASGSLAFVGVGAAAEVPAAEVPAAEVSAAEVVRAVVVGFLMVEGNGE